MTEAAGNLVDAEPSGSAAARYALERSGTELNDDFIHRWQQIDGSHRQAARRAANAIVWWTPLALLVLGQVAGAVQR